ncbi:MAG: hypothetical protein JST64_04425 [Actinobacteria bacterium]|nr:hypothetical protein [Actinomycetota bacterium]
MEGRADLAFGLATSVGPLPFSSADDAVSMSVRLHGRFPTVPVTTAPDASLLAQALHGLSGVHLDGDTIEVSGSPPGPVDAAGICGSIEAPAFEAVHLTASRLAELDGGSSAPVPVRVPVLGPVTLSVVLRRGGLQAGVAADLAVAIVTARSVAVLQALRRSSTSGERVVAVVLSEPALVGSMHPTFPLLPAEVRALLDPVVDALDRSATPGSLVIGVHVPGPCDWPTVVGSGASMLCVPVDRSVSGFSALFGDLLERGGRICWGAIPVDRPMGSSDGPHWRRLVGLWTALVADGVDPMLLRLRSSFSPADGLAGFGVPQAELVMGLTVALAERVHHQAVAARLSLGA